MTYTPPFSEPFARDRETLLQGERARARHMLSILRALVHTVDSELRDEGLSKRDSGQALMQAAGSVAVALGRVDLLVTSSSKPAGGAV